MTVNNLCKKPVQGYYAQYHKNHNRLRLILNYFDSLSNNRREKGYLTVLSRSWQQQSANHSHSILMLQWCRRWDAKFKIRRGCRLHKAALQDVFIDKCVVEAYLRVAQLSHDRENGINLSTWTLTLDVVNSYIFLCSSFFLLDILQAVNKGISTLSNGSRCSSELISKTSYADVIL